MSSRKLRICTVGILLVGLVHASSDAPQDLLSRVQQQIQLGNLDSARSQLNVAIKQFPADPSLYNLLGIIEAQSGNRSAAEADFRKALEHVPNSTGALLNLGRLYLQYASEDSKAPGQALDVYQKVLRYEPDNVEALYQSAALFATAGSFQNSLNYLNRLPGAVQGQAQALAIRCADESGLNHPALAAEFAERLLKSPDLSQADVLAALPQVQVHDEALAVKLLEGLVERQLADRAGLWKLARLYQRQGKLPDARETLERAEQEGTPPDATLC